MNRTEVAGQVRAHRQSEGLALSEDWTQVEGVAAELVWRIGAQALELHRPDRQLGYEGRAGCAPERPVGRILATPPPRPCGMMRPRS